MNIAVEVRTCDIRKLSFADLWPWIHPWEDPFYREEGFQHLGVDRERFMELDRAGILVNYAAFLDGECVGFGTFLAGPDPLARNEITLFQMMLFMLRSARRPHTTGCDQILEAIHAVGRERGIRRAILTRNLHPPYQPLRDDYQIKAVMAEKIL